jgi:Apea-like HEPN
MPLPQTLEFENLLGSFTDRCPDLDGNWSEFQGVSSEPLAAKYKVAKAPPLAFWYRDDGLSLESLLKKITEDLQKLGHVSNRDLAAVIVTHFAFARRSAGSAVECFNHLFSQIVDADVNQFFLFPESVTFKFRENIGSFTVGPFNPERLGYLSRKSGANFFELNETLIRSMPFSVERQHWSARVICWGRLVKQWIPPSVVLVPLMMHLVDEYFAALSNLHFSTFFAELKAVQEVPMALGSGWFDIQRLTKASETHRISVYLRIGDENFGCVSPSISHLASVSGGPVALPLANEFLRRYFAFEQFDHSEIHHSLKSFCHFLALAAQHRADGREDEAFLHSVIALDLLLGDSGACTSSVSTRAAALVAGALNQEYATAVKDLQRIYKARSKYVHEGKPPESGLLPTVAAVCGEVAFCLFRLQRDPRNRVAGFRNRWLNDVDFLIAATEAGRILTEDDLLRVGIATGGEARYAEFFAELMSPTMPK